MHVQTKGHPDLTEHRGLGEEEVWGFAGGQVHPSGDPSCRSARPSAAARGPKQPAVFRSLQTLPPLCPRAAAPAAHRRHPRPTHTGARARHHCLDRVGPPRRRQLWAGEEIRSGCSSTRPMAAPALAQGRVSLSAAVCFFPTRKPVPAAFACTPPIPHPCAVRLCCTAAQRDQPHPPPHPPPRHRGGRRRRGGLQGALAGQGRRQGRSRGRCSLQPALRPVPPPPPVSALAQPPRRHPGRPCCWQDLVGASGTEVEREVLTYLADPLSALKAGFKGGAQQQQGDWEGYRAGWPGAAAMGQPPSTCAHRYHPCASAPQLLVACGAAGPRTSWARKRCTHNGPAPQVMVTVSLLSMHAEGEQTLDERNTLILVRSAAPGPRAALRQPAPACAWAPPAAPPRARLVGPAERA